MAIETIVNETTKYAVNSIQDEIQMKALWMFVKFGFSALAGFGASQRDLRQIRAFLVVIVGILSIWGLIDLIQIMTLALQ